MTDDTNDNDAETESITIEIPREASAAVTTALFRGEVAFVSAGRRDDDQLVEPIRERLEAGMKDAGWTDELEADAKDAARIMAATSFGVDADAALDLEKSMDQIMLDQVASEGNAPGQDDDEDESPNDLARTIAAYRAAQAAGVTAPGGLPATPSMIRDLGTDEVAEDIRGGEAQILLMTPFGPLTIDPDDAPDEVFEYIIEQYASGELGFNADDMPDDVRGYLEGLMHEQFDDDPDDIAFH